MHNTIRTILCAADLDDGYEEVLAYAIGLASQTGATLQVLTVIDDQRETSLVEVDTLVPQAVLDKYHDDRAQRVRQHLESRLAALLAARADKNAPPPPVEVIVREDDDAAPRILDQVDDGAADLIVMGSRGDGALVGLLFGSVVQEVTRRTRTPLLLVPLRGRDEQESQSR
ncbi:universal stress protein [Cupriavidus necator]